TLTLAEETRSAYRVLLLDARTLFDSKTNHKVSLPGKETDTAVRGLDASPHNGLRIATSCGFSYYTQSGWLEISGKEGLPVLIYTTWSVRTFPQKADQHEQITVARHDRDGFVTDCPLTEPDSLASFVYEGSENDGL